MKPNNCMQLETIITLIDAWGNLRPGNCLTPDGKRRATLLVSGGCFLFCLLPFASAVPSVWKAPLPLVNSSFKAYIKHDVLVKPPLTPRPGVGLLLQAPRLLQYLPAHTSLCPCRGLWDTGRSDPALAPGPQPRAGAWESWLSE